jgi:hypothetical protein
MTEPRVRVPAGAVKATKAVAATLTSAAGVVALAVTAMGDGSVSWAEGGTLLTAVLTAAATIGAVWGVRNDPKTRV